jgi:hypothetical protein
MRDVPVYFLCSPADLKGRKFPRTFWRACTFRIESVFCLDLGAGSIRAVSLKRLRTENRRFWPHNTGLKSLRIVSIVLLGIQTPQFAQDTSLGPAKTDQAKLCVQSFL